MANKKNRQINNMDETKNKEMHPCTNSKGGNLKQKADSKKQLGESVDKSDIKKEMHEKELPNITVVEQKVLQYIVGQDNQVRQIITAIYRSIKCKTIKTNALIIGGSGTGKTETIKQVAKILNIPYTIEDATKYTQEGYYGADVKDMIYNLISNANNDVEKAKYGMIIIDEIDKKTGYENNDMFKTEVLKSLLKIIEGTKIKISYPLNEWEYENSDNFLDSTIDFDTKDIIVICLGAFSGLEKIRDKRLNTNAMGFIDSTLANQKNSRNRFTKQDLVKYGMPEEFVGRIDTIIEMNKLNKYDLELILKRSKLSILKMYENELKQMGIKLSYNKRIYERIAEKSMAVETGARELSNIVNYMFENIMYDVFAKPNTYTKCTLELDIVDDNTKYTMS